MIRRALLPALLASLPALAQAPEADPAVARAVNLFGLDLYARCATAEGNLVLSPYGIASALAMVHAGAESETAGEIRNALYLPVDPPAGVAHESLRRRLLAASGREAELAIANALWGQKDTSFQASFIGALRDRFGAHLERVDFGGAPGAAADAINGWVAEATHERIRDLVAADMFSTSTRLVLTNAIYFRSAWARPFDAEETREMPFHLGDGKSIPVPMMRQKGSFLHSAAEGLQLLEMRYEADKLSMVILLHEGGPAAIEKQLSVERLEQWLKGGQRKEVEVFLPRFEVTLRFALADALQALGIKLAFSKEADFSGMNANRDLFLAAVAHKAFVAVDEKGTEAAAATAALMELKGEPGPPVVFRADRPFLFLIRERTTGCILFLGRVLRPTGSD